jgi:hypothetical protein
MKKRAGDSIHHNAQTVDYTTLLLVTREMTPRLVPGRLEQAIQTDDSTLLLQFKSFTGLSWVLISWHPESARVALEPSGPPGGKAQAASRAAYSLPNQLKVFLQLKTLIGVSMPVPGERIVALDFADRVTDQTPTHRVRHCAVVGVGVGLPYVSPAYPVIVTTCGSAQSRTESPLCIVCSCMWR